MKFNLSVAAEIRAELARQNRTQSELAAAMHLSTAAVSRMLSGKVTIDLAQLAVIARFLRTTPGRLVRDAERAGVSR